MSRSGAKAGSKEKSKPMPPSQPSVVTPDIVPGKFSENDWIAMVERDNAEDFVLDFIEEILAHAMDSIYKLYLHRQVVPFTISQAAKEMLHIVEWKFLGRDDGEECLTECGWAQDEEPNAAVMDSWAQGAVPRTEVMTSFLIHEEEELSAAEEEKKETEMETSGLSELCDQFPEAETVQEQPPKETTTKRKLKVRRKLYRPKVKPSVQLEITESLQQPQQMQHGSEKPSTVTLSAPASGFSLRKLSVRQSRDRMKRLSRFSNTKFDEEGNVVSFEKLDADTLPSHRVNIRFQIVEQSEGSEKHRESLRHGPALNQPDKKLAVKTSLESVAGGDYGKSIVKTRKFIPMDCPPSLLESINVVPGVTVLESGRTKKLAKRHMRMEDTMSPHAKDMQPISTALRDRSNTISVSDLLDRNSPIIRPLDNGKPLPPIVPASSQSGNFST